MDSGDAPALLEIEEEKTLLGKKRYIYDGLAYESLADAEEVRENEIRARERAKKLEVQKKLEAERAQAEEEAEEKRREAERKIKGEIIAQYEKSPEYVTYWVSTKRIKDMREHGLLWKKVTDTGLYAGVDLADLGGNMHNTLRDIALQGYEVVTILPVTSGVGSWKALKGESGGGAGWGFSFTSGVVITARRKSNK